MTVDILGYQPNEQTNNFSNDMWCVARFGTFVQFKKREKHPWRSVNFGKHC